MILWIRLNIQYVLIYLPFLFKFHEISYKQMIYITDDDYNTSVHSSHPLSLLTIKRRLKVELFVLRRRD